MEATSVLFWCDLLFSRSGAFAAKITDRTNKIIDAAGNFFQVLFLLIPRIMVEFKAARKANIKNIVNVFNGSFSENQKALAENKKKSRD